MPHRRPRQRGSFGSHFDDLVEQFPVEEKPATPSSTGRPEKLQQKIDIHRLLFERAWKLD